MEIRFLLCPIKITLTCQKCKTTSRAMTIRLERTTARLTCHACANTWRVLVDEPNAEIIYSDEAGIIPDFITGLKPA